MKISLNWLKQFTNIDMPVDDLVAKIGAQLGAVEEVIDLGVRYAGVIIAKVVSCENHPNADRLHVCMIDDGGVVDGVTRNDDGLVQVVCGAPNVRAGLTVAWLPPKTVVPATFETDPFTLDSRELRGVMSNGMLASSKELRIGDDHSGILEIDLDVEPGTSFAQAYELDDYIIDIENKMFTHRPDCFGILGVAREIAGIQHIEFNSPVWYVNTVRDVALTGEELPLEVENAAHNVVPRFMAIVLRDVVVKSSPIIMQTYLARLGVRPINNVVDITNYIMVLTGQPLHAYDYDKVASLSGEQPSLVARLASIDGEQVKLLNGKTVTLSSPAIVIATDKQVIGVGGVMGGSETEVTTETKNIILECANFDMYSIRKTSMRYGLFTDAVTRFNKGQSFLQNEKILYESIAMVQNLASAQIAGRIFDEGISSAPNPDIIVTPAFINARLGLGLNAQEIKHLLINVEFGVKISGDELHISAPFWRTDIQIPEDIVEEVGRLYGFDSLPLQLPLKTLLPAAKNHDFELKRLIRSYLSSAGANEVLTYNFVHGRLIELVGQSVAEAYSLSNALSPELQHMRLSLTPSLLEKVYLNVRSGFDTFSLFELNKAHLKSVPDPFEGDLPAEHSRLGFVYVATKAATQSSAAYYCAKYYLDYLAERFGVGLQYVALEKSQVESNLSAPFEPKRSAAVYVGETNEFLGVVGEYRAAIHRGLKLPEYCAGFEIDISPFLSRIGKGYDYTQLAKFPKVQQDITLRAAGDITYATLNASLSEALRELCSGNYEYVLSPVDRYKKDGEETISTTFHVAIWSQERTLQAAHVNSILDQAVGLISDDIGVVRV